MMKARIRRATAIILSVIVIVVIPGQVVQATHQTGEINWATTRDSWPKESEASYWLYSSEVDVRDLYPGEGSRPVRLTLGNELDVPTRFWVQAIGPTPVDSSVEALPSMDWVSFSLHGNAEAVRSSAELVTVEPKIEGVPGQRTVWVHVNIPRDSEYVDKDWQFMVSATPAEGAQGEVLYSTVSVATAAELASGHAGNAPLLGLLLLLFLLSIVVVYVFVRWWWPGTPGEDEEVKESGGGEGDKGTEDSVRHETPAQTFWPSHWE
jgi:hypothetical protein